MANESYGTIIQKFRGGKLCLRLLCSGNDSRNIHRTPTMRERVGERERG
jgi:hypothetical protein